VTVSSNELDGGDAKEERVGLGQKDTKSCGQSPRGHTGHKQMQKQMWLHD